jgi:hypothetical protein
MLETDLRTWLGTLANAPPIHFAHLDKSPGARFGWFVRSGDESLDTIDGEGEADIIYFDLELHSDDLAALVALASALSARRDYRGALGEGYVEDVAVDDHRDDYESQTSLDTLPQFMKAFRLTISGYLGAT